MRNRLPVRSEEQANKVPKILPTNEIARNKICSADLLNGHEWRKVGCVVREKNVKMSLNEKQAQALNIAEYGHNVLVTGQGGTGKSFLIKEIWLLSKSHAVQG
jgi:Cdc6-like AAA superfamily ATPase